MKHQAFSYQTKQELLADFSKKGTPLGFSDDFSILALPLNQNNITIKNRLLSQPIEGFDAESDGTPTHRSVARYQTLAENGFGTLWFESISVSDSGRSNLHQLWITDNNLEYFSDMLHHIRASAGTSVPYLVAQLTHSGRYSYQTPVCGFENPHIEKAGAHIITDDELAALEAEYVHAALLAKKAGFDAVDIRACHGYLINEMFAAYHRPGCYGGSFENRMRLLLNIVRKVRDSCDITIAVRLNLYDGLPYPFGWGVRAENGTTVPDLHEPMMLVDQLCSLGVKILNISSGIGAVSPYVLRPYDRGGMPCPEHPLEGVYRMVNMSHHVKAAHPECIVVASALSWLREFAPMVAASEIQNGWYDLAGFGRQAICYPEFAHEILHGNIPDRDRCCTTCCGCTNLIKKSGSRLRCIRKSE